MEKWLENKEKSERKFIRITTLKKTLGHSLGRKVKREMIHGRWNRHLKFWYEQKKNTKKKRREKNEKNMQTKKKKE